MLDLARKRIILGLTGGIACYKAAELVSRLTEQAAAVDVVMTEAATHFITPVTLQALSGRPVFMDAWDARIHNNMAHIDLTRGADAVLVAPASADFIAKLAHGLADDLLSTLCLARACPLLVAPAMNRAMWAHPATQRNVAQLRADGVTVLGPTAGDQACGETGDGRMLEAHELLSDLIAFFQPKVLTGRHVLLTAGPTSEPVDPVRVFTNRSSGKTGYAIAQAAHEAGARVTLVTGPTALTVPRGVTAIHVTTALQMRDAVMASVTDADVFIAVAAVADWRVKNMSEQKLKRTTEGGAPPVLVFEPNPDILAEVVQLPNGPWCVGFAAETEKLHEYAQAKRQRKNIPLMVGNLAHKVMDADTTELVLFDARGAHSLPAAPKLAAARRLIAEIAARLP
jgi:phosphopantothenoylcysteine decarboxylase/phosphopantothenate--cysteine ligase